MKIIGFAGAPCTGKTTLSQRLAVDIRIKTNSSVQLIDEYAAWFIKKFGNPDFSEHLTIIDNQIYKEKHYYDCADYIITDSPCFLSYIYMCILSKVKDNKSRYFLSIAYNKIFEHINNYDYIFYLKPLLDNLNNDNFSKDNIRIHTKKNEIISIDNKIKGFMDLYNIGYINLEGNFEQKLKNALKIIDI